MWSLNFITARFPMVLLSVTLLIAGCSSSSSDSSAGSSATSSTDPGTDSSVDSSADSGTGSSPSSNDAQSVPADNTVVADNQNGNQSSESDASFTRVNFDITVPAYSSDSLQVSLVSNNRNLTAAWVVDETWTISEEFTSNTQHPLVVTFSDNNGAIVLGQVETQFVTGPDASQLIRVNADQFNTAQWDDDGDGVSNFSELTAGSNPLGEDLPMPVQNDLEFLPIKTVRISWQATPGVDFYRVLENPDGVSGFEQLGDDLDSSVLMYDHRISLFARANAMYMVQACDAVSCSNSAVQAVSDSLANAVGSFQPSFLGFQTFGDSVDLSADGTTLVVGSSFDGSGAQGIDGDPVAPNPTPFGRSGSVHVFTLTADGWAQQAYIKASDSERDFEFGRRLSLSDDGNTMAVRAPGAGKTYIYERSNGEWTETAILDGSFEMSLSGDGNTLAFTFTSTFSMPSNDTIQIFERSGSSWQLQWTMSLTSELAALTDRGVSLNSSLNRDGNILAVGVENHVVFIFEKTDDGWVSSATLSASNADVSDRFGDVISLSANGDTLVVGARDESSFASGVNGFESDNTKRRSGAAYIFINNNGIWEQQAYLKAGVSDATDNFGISVSISANGNTVAIGAENEDGASVGINGDQNDNSQDRPGAAYVFVRNNGIWQQQAYVKASDTNGFALFGESISLSGDGSTLAVGSSVANGSGTVYLY